MIISIFLIIAFIKCYILISSIYNKNYPGGQPYLIRGTHLGSCQSWDCQSITIIFYCYTMQPYSAGKSNNWRQNQLRHFALKGLSNIFASLKKEKIKFSFLHNLHVMLYHCSSYLQKTTNAPTCNEGERGRVWIVLLFEVTPLKDNVSAILLPIAHVLLS